jgi:hypothetical protein
VLNKVLKKSKNLLKKKNDKLFACPGKNFQHKNLLGHYKIICKLY